MEAAAATWPPDAAHVRAARQFVESQLAAWRAEHLGWAACTVVSELATNAVLHAHTPFTVELQLDRGRLRLAVTDDSPALPLRRHFAAQATTGRGLHLVDRTTSRWGVESNGHGKTVWCEFDGAAAAVPAETDADRILAAFPDDL